MNLHIAIVLLRLRVQWRLSAKSQIRMDQPGNIEILHQHKRQVCLGDELTCITNNYKFPK